jgi:hypothetical protein
MEKVGLCLTGMACNKGICFLPYWNGLNEESQFWLERNGSKWRKSVLARLEWLGLKELSFGPTEIAWNGGSWFWPNLNGLEWRKSVLA